MKLKSITMKAFLRGLVAVSGVWAQSKGSVPRASNLLLTKRGSFVTCDGSGLLHEFGGAIQSGRGKITCIFLFSPTGVPSYYLVIGKALDIPLGPPQNLTVATAAGGSLAAATYFYVVTALDGAGGETTASNEVNVVTGANGKNTLTWNVVPNAQGYNVYRSTASGGEALLMGSTTATLPVAQVAPGTPVVSFVDDGTTTLVAPVFNITANGATQFHETIPTLVNLFSFAVTTPIPSTLTLRSFTVAGCSPLSFNAVYGTLPSYLVGGQMFFADTFGAGATQFGGGGTLTVTVAPPLTDTTQQVALYQMPVIAGSPAVVPVSYGNGNIVALFPADVLPRPIGGGGGPGGGGGTKPGGSTSGGTPGGGIPGNTTLIPQMIQFTNRIAIALGNGFSPQLFSDSTGTKVNPATTVAIASISVDAFGVVTVTTTGPHGLSTSQVGANVGINGVTNPVYNFVGPTIQIVSPTQYKVRNLAAIGAAASSGGTSTTTAIPLTSAFTPAFPTWSATTNYAQNSIVQPTPANNHFYKAIQGGVTGGAQPAFPTGTGQQVSDGQVIWQEAGLTNTAAPPPPGAAHLWVNGGALYAFNTSPTPTSNGLDGPTALRQSDINNPLSWNPINTAFLDKDDGTEGMGLASFTITAQGIPPEGSLMAFKNYTTYQILGLFGAPNFSIQRVKSTMGCLAPRSTQFVPGFGITRFTHLGFAVFDGVDDRVISEEVRPYLFPSNFLDDKDITVLDADWQSVMWGFQTVEPSMYCIAIPIGRSQSQLTRILCYDLVLKAWAGTVDLPFPISTAAQFTTFSTNPVTVLGGFSDGALSRWQAGDINWDTGGTGVRVPSTVNWSVRTPTAASSDPDQNVYYRRLYLHGINTNSATSIKFTLRFDGVSQPAYSSPAPSVGDIQVECAIGETHNRVEADISGSGDVEIDSFAYHIVAKQLGPPLVIV